MWCSFVAQIVDVLLQRLHAGGVGQIVVHKDPGGQPHDLADRGAQDGELMQALVGELDLLVVDLLGGLGHHVGVVGDTLKV